MARGQHFNHKKKNHPGEFPQHAFMAEKKIDGIIVLAGLALLKLDTFIYSCIAITSVGLITSLIKGK